MNNSSKKKKTYNQNIYGIDIETSTIYYHDNEPYYLNENYTYTHLVTGHEKEFTKKEIEKTFSYMISWCVGVLDTCTGEYINLKHGKTYDDLDFFLYGLNSEVDDNTLVYIHNFAYEYSFFINNLEFFKEKESDDERSKLYLSANKPLYIVCDKLEFRCSYQLLNKSITTIGKELQLPKLEYSYNTHRRVTDELSYNEWAYNYRDVEIMLKAVYNVYNVNQFMDNIGQMPFTKTGLMRFNCEHNPLINKEEYYTNKQGRKRKSTSLNFNNFLMMSEKASDLNQLKFWESCFMGGLVYSNPKFCGKVLENIDSFDFSSDYPFQMLFRIYPKNFEEYYGDNLKKLQSLTRHIYVGDFIAPKPFKHAWNGIIEITNLKQKYDFQPIGTSKIENYSELINGVNCTIINGKILACNIPITMRVTVIDYMILKTFYTFDLIGCTYLEIAKNYAPSTPYKINSVLFNGQKKSEYKKYMELLEKYDKQFTEEEIPDSYFRNTVNSESDYYKRLDKGKQLYQNVKSDLNALYGDNAQHLLKEHILYDREERVYKESDADFEEYKERQLKTSYIYGLHVPAYARLSICYFAYKAIKMGIDVAYIDTDSIKLKATQEFKELVSHYNKSILEYMSKYKLDFGTLEHEGTYNLFTSLGSKSYIYQKGDKIHATISGLPHATQIYKELLDIFDGDFRTMIDTCYNFGTTFDVTCHNKLLSEYIYDTHTEPLSGYSDTLVSGVTLHPTSVTMRDFSSKTWYKYATIISQLYKIPLSTIILDTVIYRDKSGNIRIRRI